MIRRHASIAALALLACACATEVGHQEVNAPGSQTPAVVTRPGYVVPQVLPQSVEPVPTTPHPVVPFASLPKNVETSGAGAAVISLAQKARTQCDGGQLEACEATLARALRIEPRNAFIWQALASAHLAQRQYEEAESEAQKSNSLGRGNPYLEAPNWQTIAAARAARGDDAGALQARTQADELSHSLSP